MKMKMGMVIVLAVHIKTKIAPIYHAMKIIFGRRYQRHHGRKVTDEKK
jgi:hypothetical protein